MKAKIKADMMTAWKAKEIKKRDFLKFVIGEIERKEDANTKLSNDEIQALLIKIDKNLLVVGGMESVEQMEFLTPYLPVMMHVDEIKEVVTQLITNGEYSGMKDMGKVMGDFNANFKGKADGKVLSGIVKELLV